MDACEATRMLVEYYTSTKLVNVDSLRQRIAALQDCLARMSDPPQSDPETKKEPTFIDQTIDALQKRAVSQPDRGRLRGALDKADAPLTGKDAGNEAIGRITRFK